MEAVMTLSEEWQELLLYKFPEPMVVDFRDRLHITVGQDFSWLTGQLYELEGYLGWGPGSREYDGEGYPPKFSWSNYTMKAFLKTLEEVDSDMWIVGLLFEAQEQGKFSENIAVRTLAACLRKRQAYWQETVDFMYGRIASVWPSYVLGAARIYRLIWERQAKYALAVAGLSRLLYYPISYTSAESETVRRRRQGIIDVSGVLPSNQDLCVTV
jgi:hypothetical protein